MKNDVEQRILLLRSVIFRAAELYSLFGRRPVFTEHQLRSFAEAVAFNDQEPSFSFSSAEWLRAFDESTNLERESSVLGLASPLEVEPLRWELLDPPLLAMVQLPSRWQWSFLIATADPDQLHAIGATASSIDATDAATRAWTRVIDLRHPDAEEARRSIESQR
ncbi:MAG: hypothetical protein ACRBK7_03210 [Acidimicrobiales bacterium]